MGWSSGIERDRACKTRGCGFDRASTHARAMTGVREARGSPRCVAAPWPTRSCKAWMRIRAAKPAWPISWRSCWRSQLTLAVYASAVLCVAVARGASHAACRSGARVVFGSPITGSSPMRPPRRSEPTERRSDVARVTQAQRPLFPIEQGQLELWQPPCAAARDVRRSEPRSSETHRRRR